MFTKERLNEPTERRHLLQLEADLHRSIIGLELESIRARVANLNHVRERVTSNRPLLVAGSAVAGLLTMRHWRGLARWIPTAVTALRLVKSLKGR